MRETLVDLKNRRSCRKYLSKQVSDEQLNDILEAGIYAPTGKGIQSPIIVVVQDRETIEVLSKLNAQILGRENIDPFFGAPTVLIVLADKNVSTYVEDGSLVMGNLMNAACAVGVDSCWIHRAKEEFESPIGKALMEKWGIGDNYQGIGHCILGYADGPLPEPKPRKANWIIRA